LRFLLENPASQADDLRGLYGWSRSPLFLKLPPPAEPGSPKGSAERLLGLLKGFFLPTGQTNNTSFFLAMSGGGEERLSGHSTRENNAAGMPVTGVPHVAAPRGETPAPKPPQVPLTSPVPSNPVTPPGYILEEGPAPHPGAVETPSTPHLNAYLLGNFRVIINETPLEALSGGRGRAVFAYLLAQRGHPVPRDVIMDAFWPDASAEAARNSLNVAIYSLRQVLKPALVQQTVLYQDNAYLLNPAIYVWLDIEAFEQSVQDGRQNEAAGRLIDSTRDYERSLSLYQGDFLADLPYEGWAVLKRERLRVLYLETLDHLSLIYFGQGQYAACTSLCQRMLAHDSCREDAHCRLMRCYVRQGQVALALRQYQMCVEALRRDLDVAPAPATMQLYEQIRRHDSV